MFALELTFSSPSPRHEYVLVRKPALVIGSNETATVNLNELSELDYQLSVSRELGRKFRVTPISLQGQPMSSSVLEGLYENEAEFTLGAVGIKLIAIDGDLALKENEPPDRAGVRVLRQAAAQESPKLPAVMLRGNPSGVFSFGPDQVLYIGRGPENSIQVDAVDVSYKHARIGYESGSFWVEDLGSTNGTFYQEQQISTRTMVPTGAPIILGRDTTIIGISGERDINAAERIDSGELVKPHLKEKVYPALVSMSEVVRPSRLVLEIDDRVNLGRDPKNDLWLGVPQVSREHCSFIVSKTGEVLVKDHSTNGTVYDEGILQNSEELSVRNRARVFDFGQNVTVAVCFNEEQESQFTESGGAADTFLNSDLAPTVFAGSTASKKALAGSVSYLDRLKAVYKSLGLANQIVLIFTVLAVFVIFIVITGLLTQVFI